MAGRRIVVANAAWLVMWWHIQNLWRYMLASENEGAEYDDIDSFAFCDKMKHGLDLR